MEQLCSTLAECVLRESDWLLALTFQNQWKWRGKNTDFFFFASSQATRSLFLLLRSI